MQIESSAGSSLISNLDVLSSSLSRELQKTNEIWLHEKDRKNPSLCLLTNGDCFYGCSFPRDGHPGFNSLSRAGSVNDDGDTIFSMDGEDTEISNKYLITSEEAVEAAKEFFLSRDLPSCIDWEEL